MNTGDRLLEISELRTCFVGRGGRVEPLRGIGLHIEAGQTLALVGESGCGKSTLALSILRLLPERGHICSGNIRFEGRDLLQLSERDMRQIRGRDVGMVFQDPRSAFHPLMTLGDQLIEAVKEGPKAEKKQRALDMLESVGLADPSRVMKSYSFELSGGMLQRVMIAMALINRPKLLIADEPTTALDVTVQSDILQLLKKMKAHFGMSMLFISHDLGVVAEIADRVAVMHKGQIVECGDAKRVYRKPEHEVTRHLLSMAPVLGQPLPRGGEKMKEAVLS
ncbi:ABC transporter ATP-binding protein [Paenibacillus hamazuiensis]|uniref:ABC transporter ATP-binding protein n=1 Tax=Paenibacillus hamazuiensis TaxID=2936508 RepID=UPI00200D9B70|nr:ABC transporter ATP-binding protein [Paenibacillus hamazuiensis]